MSSDPAEMLLRLAGLEVPPERLAGTLRNCRDLRRMADSLHVERPAEAEPAAVFTVLPTPSFPAAGPPPDSP